MTYRAHIKNGVAVLDQPVSLPDGMAVRIQISPADSEFWQNRSIDELATDQGVQVCDDPRDIAGDFPADESIDHFLDTIKRSRV